MWDFAVKMSCKRPWTTINYLVVSSFPPLDYKHSAPIQSCHLPAKLFRGNPPPQPAMAIKTLDELVAYAQANFPEDFTRLPPVDTFTVKEEDRVAYLVVGTKLARYSLFPSDEVLYTIPTPVIQPSSRKARVQKGPFFSYEVFGTLQTRSLEGFALIEPFCWIEEEHNVSTDKLAAFVRYCLATKISDLYLEPTGGYFLSLFQQVCRDIAKGMDHKEEKQRREDKKRKLDIELSDNCKYSWMT
jgi:hypothetical protein